MWKCRPRDVKAGAWDGAEDGEEGGDEGGEEGGDEGGEEGGDDEQGNQCCLFTEVASEGLW